MNDRMGINKHKAFHNENAPSKFILRSNPTLLLCDFYPRSPAGLYILTINRPACAG
jgi:hypothetical protein